MNWVKNVYCVGRNFSLHATELGNTVPTKPIIFMKPTHAMVHAEGQQIALPSSMGEIHHELELVIHVGSEVEKDFYLEQVIDTFSLGIDFTLRDVQNDLKRERKPWLLAKGFKNSAVVGNFVTIPSKEELCETTFCLLKNGEKVQAGKVNEMMFSLSTIIQYIKDHIGIDKGDIIYTGTPAGVGKVQDGDHLQMYWGNKLLGECHIDMQDM